MTNELRREPVGAYVRRMDLDSSTSNCLSMGV